MLAEVRGSLDAEGRPAAAGIADRLVRETRIVRAVAATGEGEFMFDVRDGAVGWTIAAGGWELLETELVKHLLRPGDLMIDGGANLGWYATIAARTVGEAGRVVAFEPDPANFALLETNLRMNGVAEWVDTKRVALYDRTDRLTFEHSTSNFGDHRVRTEGAPAGNALYGENTRTTSTVDARTLDDVLDELGLATRPIKLFKVDTQGSEVAIFRGAQRTLARTEHLISECWPYGIARAGATMDEYIALVGSNFSGFARLNSESIVLRPIAEFAADLQRPADNAPGTPVQYSDYLFKK